MLATRCDDDPKAPLLLRKTCEEWDTMHDGWPMLCSDCCTSFTLRHRTLRGILYETAGWGAEGLFVLIRSYDYLLEAVSQISETGTTSCSHGKHSKGGKHVSHVLLLPLVPQASFAD